MLRKLFAKRPRLGEEPCLKQRMGSGEGVGGGTEGDRGGEGKVKALLSLSL